MSNTYYESAVTEQFTVILPIASEATEAFPAIEDPTEELYVVDPNEEYEEAYKEGSDEDRGPLKQKLSLAAKCGAFTMAAYAALVYGGNVVLYDEYNVAERASVPIPAAVLDHVNDAVKIQTHIPPHAKTLPDGKTALVTSNLSLSGVSLGDGYVLSAGHGIIEDGFTPSQREISCLPVAIDGLYNEQSYQTTSSANIAHNTGFANDLALYKISETNQQFITDGNGPLPRGPEVSDTPIHVGQVVYFSNWEPTDKDVSRGPVEVPGRNTPAVFPGVVTSVGDVLTVSTDITSLGKGLPDQNIRPGASGGEVLDEKGNLIGLSNGMYDSAAHGTLHSLLLGAANAHIGPFGLPGNGLQIADVTPVTPEKVAKMREELSNTPPC